ncbi:hypothetical protein BOX15_Mlig002222g3 [Macrostomum lignano]|uniref:SH3 domain-containing protein n=1 Tax=Macrostomum lignano TaxID=282301 RepID=A0A267E2J3_9PLAT|nr:hypothetical protein BOX15_Mlig002222g1 [Macrostomum lignano]PAA81493.1 hypothetical protein BOX15_Mlig002222g3 [Macrostomum lignano]
MSKLWNENLWDTFNPHVYNFNKFNFEFLKTFTEFLKRRCKIEETYCKELRKLCCDCRPKDYNSNSKEYARFSVQAAFDSALGELISMADQRNDLLIQKLRDTRHQLQKELTELRDSAAKAERRIAEKSRDLETSRKKVTTARSQYHRAHADQAKATTPEAQEQRRQQCAAKRTVYEGALGEFNELQRQYYHSDLLEQLNRLEMLQRNFCTVSRNAMVDCADAETATLAEQTRSATGMSASVNRIDAEADAATFVRITASDEPLPNDMVLEEPATAAAGTLTRPVVTASKSLPAAGASNAAPTGNPTDAGDSVDGAEKLKRKITGLKTLFEAYKANPSLGDASVVESELRQAMSASDQIGGTLINRRQPFRDEFETNEFDVDAVYSTVDENEENPVVIRNDANKAAIHVSYEAHAAMSPPETPARPPLPAPDESPAPDENPAPATADPGRPMSIAPAVDEPPEPAYDTIVSLLYDFKDDTQSSVLSVTAGEQVLLLRLDDEWSLVSRLDKSESGYVPTAYISLETPSE